MRYRTVLFDMDYTLGDATGGILACFRHALSSMGYPDYSDDILCDTIGHTLEDSFSIVTGEQAPEKRRQFQQFYARKAEKIMGCALRLYPDAMPLLQYLQERGCRMAVVSTRPAHRLETMLSVVGARSFFVDLIGVDSIPNPKPSPDAILEAMKRCGAEPESTLYLGDTVIDAEAAFRAGVDFAAVTTGRTPPEAFEAFPACIVADCLKTVQDWLEREERV